MEMPSKRHLLIPILRVLVLILTIVILYYLIHVRRLRIHASVTMEKTQSARKHHDDNVPDLHFDQPNVKLLKTLKHKKRIKQHHNKNVSFAKPKPIPHFLQRISHIPGIHCDVLFKGKKKSRARMAQKAIKYKMREISPMQYKNMSYMYNCWNFHKERQYITDSLSSQEKKYPIAYSITVHDSVFQFETLLRAIYRPQNYYCIHVDRKASHLLLEGVKAVIQCLSNVFCDTHRVDVRRNSLSIAHAHLSCMRRLLIYPKWKYYINLNEGDFPLKTNYEIVEILKSLNGSNDVEGIPYRHTNGKIYHPPNGLFGFTGSPRVLLNRRTADFAARNVQSNSILAWAFRTRHPYRNFFATINYNPRLNLPGTYHGPLDESVLKSYQHIVQYTTSKLPQSEQRKSCKGKLEGETCIFGVDDMPVLYKRKELFVHKVNWNYQGIVLACLEHEIQRRTRLQYLLPRKYDTRFYRKLKFIKYST